MIQTVRVTAHGVEHDTAGNSLLAEIQRLGITAITQVKTARVYRLEGITPQAAAALALKLLTDPITHFATVNEPILQGARVVEVARIPGIMNPEVPSIHKAASDLGITDLVAADSSTEYGFFGQPTDAEIQRIFADPRLCNESIQHVVTQPPETLNISSPPGPITIVPIRELTDEALIALSGSRHLFLTRDEMRVVRDYFITLGREPTDAELEVLAQTWSEHCCHKTFKARLIVNGVEKAPLMTRLKEASLPYFGDFVLSAFSDNAGVIRFDDEDGIAAKVETHNHPSAIEPYGGAGTGVGGVLRDTLGTGQGGKNIAETDIFCFGPPDLPPDRLPAGCLHPRHLLTRVVAGVGGYGNPMGVPTVNGSTHFHPDFLKPMVMVGAYALIPIDRCRKGQPCAGDLIVAIGGRTGRDGVHGATFSSAEMTHQTATIGSGSVQIGNPIVEQCVSETIRACRDRGLIRALTDCGAGGFSCAIGEIGADTGVRMQLEKAPLKYQGLAPWEILISEAQERMMLAVAPEHQAELLAICGEFNVEATVLGEFTADHKFTVTFHGSPVCDLDMAFLHHGMPQRVMTARWTNPTFTPHNIPPLTDWPGTYRAVVSHLNVCSREPIVRRYDHGVQGATVLYPYAGVHHDGPNDAAVLQPKPGKPDGVVLAHGLNPILMRLDPYWGALWAGVEALSNLVAVGGNFRETGLLDNFYWPSPDDPEWLGALDRAMDGCVDFMHSFWRPFVSGKDSLGGTYRGSNGLVIHIPPVLCVSVVGRIPDVAKTITADFKHPDGSLIVLLGRLDPGGMGGSVYADVCGCDGGRPPHVNIVDTTPLIFDRIYRLIGEGVILACHDISEGGVGVALAEMCFGGDCGAVVDLGALDDHRPDLSFFSETAGCFLVEVSRVTDIENLFLDLPYEVIGLTTQDPTISLSLDERKLCSLPVGDLKAAWQQPMKEIFS